MDARHWRKLVTMAEDVTQRTLRRLPAELRERAAAVPVVFEPWISEEIAGEELDPDALGLFVGDPHGTSESTHPMPPQIFLFLESLWDFAEADEEIFREEVRVTYLHELGHYLGLDEGDLEQRGLE
jgi:predicted Zn-dependent protease with MMP-like domain